MKRNLAKSAIALVALSLVVGLGQLQAQTNKATVAKAPQASLTPTERTWVDEMKNPYPWLNWGADLRIRNEYINNALTLSPNDRLHEQDYFRFRGRLWAGITPVDDVSFNARLAAEAREWLKPAGYSPMKGRPGLDMTEGVFDNLYVKWKNVLNQPATLSVGRQDLFVGDGWLVGDGTPYDGSWTYFLDSARLTYEFKESHTTIDAIGIMQDRRDDGWMPVINSGQHRFLTEQNEKGAILSVGNNSMPSANLTGYFIYKTDQAGLDSPRGADNANIYTLGGRITGLLGDNWKYWLEGAYQLGEKQDSTLHDNAWAANHALASTYRDIDAFGFNSRVTYMLKDKLNNQFTFSYEYISGDDPRTGKDEMFDVLWGRWPRWSEIGLYSFAAETRIGQEANLHRAGPTWTFNPIKDMEVNASYFVLAADQDVPTRAASTKLFSGTDSYRGSFASAFLKYKFNRHLAGHLWSELFFPGDYYAKHSMWSFLRAEIYLTF